jgi:hypothetical protein
VWGAAGGGCVSAGRGSTRHTHQGEEGCCCKGRTPKHTVTLLLPVLPDELLG